MRKKSKRLIALLVSLLMVISLIPTTGLTVEAATKPKLAKKSVSIVIGGTSKIKIKNAPKGAKITYKSAKKSIATVSEQGKVKGIKSGTTKITVSVKETSKTTKLTYKVTVKKPKLSKSKLSLVSGRTAKLSIKNKPKKATYTWTSSNSKVATINKTGKVTAKAKGTATIKTRVKTAKKIYNLSCKVNVTDNSDNANNEAQTYIVTFDSNGGSSVAPQTVKKYELAQQPANPVRNGYTFDGWYTAANGGQKFNFKTAITANITLYAHWNIDEKAVPILTINNLSETETNNVDTENIDISGAASSSLGTIKDVSYSLKFALDETASINGKAEGTKEWKIKGLPLQVGTSFLTITVSDSENRTTQKVITLNRLSTEIELSDNVILYTEEQTDEIADSIIDYWTDDMGTADDTYDDQTKILFSEDSEIVQSIKAGLIEVGDVVMLQPSNELYLGFNGVLLSNEEPEDVVKFPISEYEVVTFRSADYTDIFDGDVSLSYELVDTENPLAFAYFPSEVEIYVLDDTGKQQARLYSNEKSISEELGDQSEKQEINQPGFQKNAISYMMSDALNITGGLSGSNGMNIGIKFKDSVLFDEDGKGSTTDDQFKFGGNISFNHFKVNAGIEWHPNFNPFALDLLPQQIMGKYSYTEEVNAHADWTGDVNLNDVKDSTGNKVGLVKAANKLLNNDFENNKQFLGMTLSGVDMSDSIILGAFGLQIAPTGVAPVVGIKNAQYSSTFTPLSAILVIMPVINIEGELSAKVGLTYKYTSYNEKGINMQKKDYVGAFGSLSENKGQSSKDLPFNRSLEIYNVCSKSSSDKESAPAWSLTLEGDGNAKARVAVGADIGLMMAGIMPTSTEAKLYASSEVEGQVKLSVDNEKGLTVDALARADAKVGVMAAVHFKLAVSSSLLNPEIEGNKDWDLVLWEESLSTACIDGTVFKADDKNNEVIPETTVVLIRTDQLGNPTQTTMSDSEGKYHFDNVAEGKYKLAFSKEGFDTYETDEFSVSGSHKAIDVYLTFFEKISRKNYYDFDGNLIYYDSYAYYDNGLLCSVTLHSVYGAGTEHEYYGNEYTLLYLYDENGKLEDTVLGALTISAWYNESTGEIILDYDYDEDGNSSKIAIYPLQESIEQEKFHVDASKTETLYEEAPVIYSDDAGEWAEVYLNTIFASEAPTDATEARFFYVDDNFMPELWLDYGYGYAGDEVFTVGNGTTDKVYVSQGSATCIEKENLLLVTGGHMDVYYDTLYRIEDGKFVSVAEGNYGAPDNSNIQVDENGYPIYEYEWDGVKMTEEKYKQSLENAFPSSRAVNTYQNVYTYEQCKVLLQRLAEGEKGGRQEN